MIDPPVLGHGGGLAVLEELVDDPGETRSSSSAQALVPNRDALVRALVDAHFDFIWRSLRRFGMSAADADDGAQAVFLVAARRLAEIEPGRERAFLFGTAYRVARDSRRAASRRPERALEQPEVADSAPGPEALVGQRRARELLDDVLSEMPLDVRSVFVLFELEELTAPRIAELLQVPAGTVASRLRRGRELFTAAAARLRARDAFRGGS